MRSNTETLGKMILLKTNLLEALTRGGELLLNPLKRLPFKGMTFAPDRGIGELLV
jgi:hypothetical protein